MATVEMRILFPEVAGGRLTGIELSDNYILAKFEIERNKEEAESSSTISRNESGYSINPENFEEALLKNTPAMQNQKEQPEEMCFQGI